MQDTTSNQQKKKNPIIWALLILIIVAGATYAIVNNKKDSRPIEDAEEMNIKGHISFFLNEAELEGMCDIFIEEQKGVIIEIKEKPEQSANGKITGISCDSALKDPNMYKGKEIEAFGYVANNKLEIDGNPNYYIKVKE